MSFFKVPIYRHAKYLRWVASQPSAISGMEGCQAHHMIGNGQGHMAGKACDLFTFPLTPAEHSRLHDKGYKTWEDEHGSQWEFVAKTLQRAILEGVKF